MMGIADTVTTLRMVDNPDEIVIHKVDQCSSCHTSLEDQTLRRLTQPQQSCGGITNEIKVRQLNKYKK